MPTTKNGNAGKFADDAYVVTEMKRDDLRQRIEGRQGDVDRASEATGTHERRVKAVGVVAGGQHDDA
jgi:hypothetical protein